MLLTEKYRPTSPEGYLTSIKLSKFIQKCIEEKEIPHLLLYGPPGTGKTTLAKIFIKNISCDYIYINASNENGIETVREKIVQFASTASFKPLKIIILDEADFLTINAQASLRNVIETYSNKTRFILTANFKDKISGALQSRCESWEIKPMSRGDYAQHLSLILKQEGTEHNLNDIKEITNAAFPDLRKGISMISQYTIDGKLEINQLSSTVSFAKIVEYLRDSRTAWTNIRQYLADSDTKDYQGIIRELYENMNLYGSGLEGPINILLAEYQYKQNFVADREINIMALFAEIIQLKSKNKVL